MSFSRLSRRRQAAGFTLIELMIASTISLLILGAMVGLFVNTSRSNTEMAKTSGLIENGRFALQLLENDLVHAGFWSGYIPEFDDLNGNGIPGDVPTGVPDPCQPFANWDRDYRQNLLGIPVQAYETLPVGPACLAPLAQRGGTDVLLVRHAETCVPGVGNCAATVGGRPYFQNSHCSNERNANINGTDVTPIAPNGVQLPPTASNVNSAYVGMMIRTIGGVGVGQYRLVTAYDGATRTATVTPDWAPMPEATTTYSFEYLLGTIAFPLRQGDCATATAQRRYISSIYYVSDIAHPDRPAERVPTLVRSEFDVNAGVLAHQAPQALIEGIEQFRIEVGIDDSMTRCAPATVVNYAVARAEVNPLTCLADPDPNLNTLAINRGDGTPDRYKRCTDADPCTALELANTVAVKLYVLVRSRDTTPGYTDTKTYCLGELANDGTCPAASRVAAANDAYKRHVFTSSVRLINTSGRRETP